MQARPSVCNYTYSCRPLFLSNSSPTLPPVILLTITMPRVSEKQLIIKWFLKSIELQIQHEGSESLWEALEDTYFSDSKNVEILKSSEDFNSTSSSSSSSISGTLNNSTSFSEIEEDIRINRMLFVMYLQSIRYLQLRGNWISKSVVFHNQVLPNVPEDRFI